MTGVKSLLTDIDVCKAVRAGNRVANYRALFLAEERGLIDLAPTLTLKGIALLDGIEPTAASGWHMGGATPAGDWKAARRARRERSQA
ncbi:hypothetical protein NKG99_03925 [Mesorhizobium sp. M1409]|uniref:hypothetical protein n=1 Tax=Mesorhizobium sp. M1409 TaxID=2957100 RepID=UPI00333647EE